MKASLNHIFRTIWSDALNTWVAVSEITSAKGKRSGSCVLSAAELAENDSEAGNVAKPNRKLRFKPLAIVLACCFSLNAQANPTGAQVTSGAASFNQIGNFLTITNSPNAIINWQSFSIAQGETTRFIQQSASSSVLNRVLGADPSSLLGTLTSNGRVFLINPAGILVGAGANINVPGFVASTLNLSDSNFIAGKLNFDATPNAGTIQNKGTITTPEGGTVYLIAPQVTNNGIINTPKGETILAAGNTVQLMDSGTPGVTVQITGSNSTATNLGQILADSGRIGVVGAVVNNSGTISANSLVSQGGRVFLQATSLVEAGGTITANGTSGGSVEISAAHSLDPINAPGLVFQTGSIQAQGTAGAGGSVSISGDNILSAAAINANGTTAGGLIKVQASNLALSTASAQYTADTTQGAGGDILVAANVSNYSSGSYSATGATGGNLTFAGNEIKLAGAQFNASGNNGGGNIHVGGLMHGAAGFSAQGIALSNATNVLTNSSTRFTADALQSGNGGQVVLWSDQAMRFTGNISAKGGVHGGNGGTAEVSGLTSFGYGGLTNLSATKGSNGTLLLDPNNITIISGTGGSAVNAQEFIDPHAGAGVGFGGNLTELLNGNILITSPNENFGGALAGAVYLYSPTGSLISALTGSTAGDQVGSGGITTLSGYAYGNYVVSSPLWGSSGTLSNAKGAVTWFSDTAGVNGNVSSTNSLVGSTAGDQVGSGGITQLSSGNYVVLSPNWNNTVTSATSAGAVTWVNGSTGLLSDGQAGEAVSSSNSLVGSTTGDQVGSGGITQLAYGSANGNYVVLSPNWTSSTGAVTWVNGSNGQLSDSTVSVPITGGTVSSSNSLVGSTTGDMVGSSGIIQLSSSANGNYVVLSPLWTSSTGAVTWVSGASGQLSDGNTGGQVSNINSLVGSVSGDQVGSGGITLLTYGSASGNYVVSSPLWGSGGISSNALGAVTWVNGASGLLSDGNTGGQVSNTNSLVGSVSGDQVGSGGITQLTYGSANGNYVVLSPNWTSSTGAVTWVNGSNGQLSDSTVSVPITGGTVSSSNSLVGSTTGDMVGSSAIIQLSSSANGNYVVLSPNWTSSTGAVTWVNGASGLLSNGSTGGQVSNTNSLVGSTAGDQLGSGGITQLSSGNYVVDSLNWNGNRGAVTWVKGSTGALSDGQAGEAVSFSNSLVGSAAGDQVGSGGIAQLTNGSSSGNYVVLSPLWTSSTGAVTWVNGSNGQLTDTTFGGQVSYINSLVGSTAGDMVGSSGIIQLSSSANGNYVVFSPLWTSSTGAVTWGSGTMGVSGTVSATNSLVGSATNDQVGSGGVTILNNGNYVVRSYYWNGDRGAVTWGNGLGGTVGQVSASNSLLGSAINDEVGWGGITQLNNSNYVVISSSWNNSTGAVTWGNGLGGTVGQVSASNSLLGSAINDEVGSGGITLLSSGNYVVRSQYWGSGGTLANAKGAVTWGNGLGGTIGQVSASNSLVGLFAGDQVGSGYISTLFNGNYVVVNQYWGGNTGAVTWVNGSTGIFSDGSTGGIVSSSNSITGNIGGIAVGSGGITELYTYAYDNFVVKSPSWTNNGSFSNEGAVTWINGSTGKLSDGVSTGGIVSNSNSLVGSSANDQVGNGGITQLYYGTASGNYVVESYNWNGHRGASTWVNGSNGHLSDGLAGQAVSAANSLVGSTAGDYVGTYAGDGQYTAITQLYSGNYVVESLNWNGNRGAVTWVNGSNGQLSDATNGGAVSATNSLVGSTANDHVGSMHPSSYYVPDIIQLYDTNYDYVVASQYWNGGYGAVTWSNGLGGTVGVVGALNSLVGSTTSDAFGSYVVQLNYGSNTGSVYVGSSTANARAGRAFILGATGSGTLFNDNPTGSVNIGAGYIAATLNAGTNVDLQANTDITQNSGAGITATGSGNLTLQAGNNVILNDVIHIAGALNVTANDAGAVGGPTGTGALDINATSSLMAGSINFTNSLGDINITDAQVISTGNMTINVGGNLNLTAITSQALLQSGGTQTINFTGSGAQQMAIQGGNNSSYNGASAFVESSGLQTIALTGTGTLDILVAGGSGVNNTLNAYVNGVQADGTVCTSCATWNLASIYSYGGQTITATTIEVNGGVGGNGNYASIHNASNSVAQNITTTGAISLAGGTNDAASYALYNATYPNDSVTNSAEIHSDGTQIISAGSTITMTGGGDANTLGGAFLTGKLGQDITTIGNLSMIGGLSNTGGQYGFGAPAVIGEQYGADIALNVGGSLIMTGGSGTTSPAMIGSAQGTPIISITATDISMTSNGAISQIGVLTGGSAGVLSMTTTGPSGISEDASSKINTAYLNVTDSYGGASISLYGANQVGYVTASGSNSNISYNSAGSVVFIHNGDIGTGSWNIAANSGNIDILVIGNLTESDNIALSAPGSTLIDATGNMYVTCCLSPSAGSLALTAGGLLDISGSVTSNYGGLVLTAPTVNITGSTSSLLDTQITASSLTMNGGSISASQNLDIVAGSILADNGSSFFAGNNVSAKVAGDIRLNNGSFIQSGKDITLTLTGPTSTLYLNDSVGMTSPSYILADALLTTTLNFPGRYSGGVVIDGIDTFSTTVGGSGIFTGTLSTPAFEGEGLGLIVNYSSNLATVLNPILPPIPTLTTVEPPPPDTYSTGDDGSSEDGIGGTPGNFGGDDDNNKGKPNAKPTKC